MAQSKKCSGTSVNIGYHSIKSQEMHLKAEKRPKFQIRKPTDIPHAFRMH